VSEGFLSVAQLAERWEQSSSVIYGMRHRRQGPRAIRVGRELRFPVVEVERWEREQLESAE
jgi:predicted DNA-binding transcriptional regulator AlpA